MNKKQTWSEWWLTFPSALWLIIFFVIPTAVILTFAFKPGDTYGGIGEGWTWNNFIHLLNINSLVLMWRTIWLSFLTTCICLTLALPTGYYLARTNARQRQLLLILIIVPFWSSFLIRIFAWKTLLHPEGVFKRVLIALHVVSPDTLLLYNAGAVLLVMVYTYLPFAILPIYSAAAKFKFDLLEAAQDLGATRLQAFFKVFIPSIQKGILTALLMVFIPAMGAYVIPDLVGGTKSEMLGNKIAQRTFVDRDLPEASALSLALAILALLPMVVIFSAQYRSGRRQLMLRNRP